jgi:hypothetical protein
MPWNRTRVRYLDKHSMQDSRAGGGGGVSD